MKHIDRYLSAYVVSCLIGYPESIHTEYMYQVLRESGSKSASPVLQAVLDLIRQGDPKDPEVKQEVRQWMMLRIAEAGGYGAEAPSIQTKQQKHEAIYSVHEGTAVFSWYMDGQPRGIGVCKESEIPSMCSKLKETFPNIVITRI